MQGREYLPAAGLGLEELSSHRSHQSGFAFEDPKSWDPEAGLGVSLGGVCYLLAICLGGGGGEGPCSPPGGWIKRGAEQRDQRGGLKGAPRELWVIICNLPESKLRFTACY